MAKAARANATSKTDATADPDKLVRQQAGTYRTGDDRFEVREADVGWFLVDSEQTNEFGQELIQGPFATLKAIRAALPDARAAKPAGRPRAAPKKAAKPATKAEPPPPPPPTWIEQLPKADAAGVRKLIGALEREGITDAEALVRRDREGLLPAVAARLIERRLDALVDDLPGGAAEGRSPAAPPCRRGAQRPGHPAAIRCRDGPWSRSAPSRSRRIGGSTCGSRRPMSSGVRRATRQEIPALAATLARAFAHDPFYSFLAGDAPERSQRMQDGWSGILHVRIGRPRRDVHDR